MAAPRVYGARARPVPTVTVAWGPKSPARGRAVELRGASLRGGPVRTSTDAQGREERRQEAALGATSLRGSWRISAAVRRVGDVDRVTVTGRRLMGRITVDVSAAGPIGADGILTDAQRDAWVYGYAVARAAASRRGVGPISESGTGATWGEAIARALARARIVEGQGCELAGLARVGAPIGGVADDIEAARTDLRDADREEREADVAELRAARRRGPRRPPTAAPLGLFG